LKFDQLVMFKSVAELGSLSEASKQLNKTQPAISQGIRQLESSLNLALFSRSAYRLVLSDAGKIIYQRVLRILNETSSLRQLADHIASGNEPRITLAIEASFDLKKILPTLENVQNAFPDTEILLRQEYISGALEALNNQSATLCISPLESAFLVGLKTESQFLSSGCLVNVASPKLLSRHPNLRLSIELIDEYQIVMQSSGTATQGKNFGVQDGQRCWLVNDFSTKVMLIEHGMGWGKVPENLAKESLSTGKLKRLNLTDVQNDLNLSYQIIKKQDQILGPVSQALWDQLLKNADPQ